MTTVVREFGPITFGKPTVPLDPAEVAELLAVIRQPDPAIPATELSPEEQVALFLADNAIKPGLGPGIEVCSLYRFYKAWHARLSPTPELVTPLRFSRNLKRAGFRRRKRLRLQHRGADQRLLGMDKQSSLRLREWLAQNPDAPEDRALFSPAARGKWNR